MVFGVSVVLRHPHKIHIADNVVIDDGCCLDAKGTDNDGIRIGSGVFLGRNTILSCKNGDIIVEDEANIGFNTEIFSASRVQVGKKVLIAAYTYLVGGDHLYDRVDIPVLDQGRTARGIDVGDHVWLGAHVVVTDGSQCRARRDHRRRRRGGRRDSRIRHRGGHAGEGGARPASATVDGRPSTAGL